MATKKGKKAAASETAERATSTLQGSVYDAALDEIKAVGDSDASRRKVESGPLKEGRGNDVMRLHTTLRAIDATHRSLADQVGGFQSDVDSSFRKTLGTLEAKFDDTWAAAKKAHQDTEETLDEDFKKTWETLQERFDKTWETVGTNFEATNERTTREIRDLREEMTRVLDRRFTHIDQTFASIRADIEVLKALQMELIKERIGRPELVKR